MPTTKKTATEQTTTAPKQTDTLAAILEEMRAMRSEMSALKQENENLKNAAKNAPKAVTPAIKKERTVSISIIPSERSFICEACGNRKQKGTPIAIARGYHVMCETCFNREKALVPVGPVPSVAYNACSCSKCGNEIAQWETCMRDKALGLIYCLSCVQPKAKERKENAPKAQAETIELSNGMRATIKRRDTGTQF